MPPEFTCPECGNPTGPDGWCPECGDGLLPDPDAWDDQGGDPDPEQTERERRDAELTAELRGDAKMDHWRDTEEE